VSPSVPSSGTKTAPTNAPNADMDATSVRIVENATLVRKECSETKETTAFVQSPPDNTTMS